MKPMICALLVALLAVSALADYCEYNYCVKVGLVLMSTAAVFSLSLRRISAKLISI